MEKRIEEAAGRLMKAFFEGTLIHGKSCSCAVGNLCEGSSAWVHAISGTYNEIYLENAGLIPQNPITRNFTPCELLEIEHAFEGRIKAHNLYLHTLDRLNDPDSFEGLTKSLDTLMEMDKTDYEINIFKPLKLECA